MFPLRGGHWTNEVRLDRIRDLPDLRSLNYLARDVLTVEELREPRSYTWPLSVWLDQQAEGACVGAAWAHELAAIPARVTGVTMPWAREVLYWGAQGIDSWAGGAYPGATPFYEGTSTIAGAKVARKIGFITEYRWSLSVLEFAAAVSYKGPGIAGLDWYDGMFNTDAEGFIRPTGKWRGGHCVCVLGTKVVRNPDRSIDWLRSYFTIHNSWGKNWGLNGRCRLSFADMAVLFPGGDFCLPLGRVPGIAEPVSS